MHNLKGFAVSSTLYEGGNTRVVRAVAINTDQPVIIKHRRHPNPPFRQRNGINWNTIP